MSIIVLSGWLVLCSFSNLSTRSTLCRLPKQEPLDKEKVQTTAISLTRFSTTPCNLWVKSALEAQIRSLHGFLLVDFSIRGADSVREFEQICLVRSFEQYADKDTK